jgi:hypothetical protein
LAPLPQSRVDQLFIGMNRAIEPEFLDERMLKPLA